MADPDAHALITECERLCLEQTECLTVCSGVSAPLSKQPPILGWVSGVKALVLREFAKDRLRGRGTRPSASLVRSDDSPNSDMVVVLHSYSAPSKGGGTRMERESMGHRFHIRAFVRIAGHREDVTRSVRAVVDEARKELPSGVAVSIVYGVDAEQKGFWSPESKIGIGWVLNPSGDDGMPILLDKVLRESNGPPEELEASCNSSEYLAGFHTKAGRTILRWFNPHKYSADKVAYLYYLPELPSKDAKNSRIQRIQTSHSSIEESRRWKYDDHQSALRSYNDGIKVLLELLEELNSADLVEQSDEEKLLLRRWRCVAHGGDCASDDLRAGKRNSAKAMQQIPVGYIGIDALSQKVRAEDAKLLSTVTEEVKDAKDKALKELLGGCRARSSPSDHGAGVLDVNANLIAYFDYQAAEDSVLTRLSVVMREHDKETEELVDSKVSEKEKEYNKKMYSEDTREQWLAEKETAIQKARESELEARKKVLDTKTTDLLKEVPDLYRDRIRARVAMPSKQREEEDRKVVENLINRGDDIGGLVSMPKRPKTKKK